MPGLSSVFRRLLKEAASAHLQEGWKLRGAGLVLHAPDGSWGQIVFSRASREKAGPDPWAIHEEVLEWPILEMGLTAGTCAPYLMRTVNKLDSSKPPTPNFVAAHTMVCWDIRVVLAQAVRTSAAPLELPSTAVSRYYIDLETAPAWLADALGKIAPATQALCSNRAICEWLRARDNAFSLRYAYLLARHLGLEDDLPSLEARTRRANEDERHRSLRHDWTTADRQTTYPQDWSHERFMRFVASIPP